ncbi:MAG: AMP-binding protein [Hyphomicrobiales bacterium]|nr:AMP-binding protein [Hyphomicrobiales bacterium]
MMEFASTGGVSPPGRIGRVALGDVLHRSALRFGAKVALTEGERRISYQALEADANRFAHYLIGMGLKPGDKVATLTGNSIAMVTALFGIHKAALVWVPVNIMLGVEDVGYILEHAGVSCAVVDDHILGDAPKRAIFTHLQLPLVGVATPAHLPLHGATDFAGALQGQRDDEPEVEIHDRDLAAIMYTSGTTARPKGAMHGHLAIVMAAMSNAIEWSLTPGDAMSGQLPVFHCAAHAGLVSVLVSGGTFALMRGFDAKVLIETIERDRLTLFVGHPLMFGAVLEHPALKTHDISSLRLCIYGLAPMGEALQRRVVSELCANLVCASGQTEMYPMTTGTRPGRCLQRFGNYWGESLSITQTAIMAEDGTLLPAGVVGELVHRGPNVMLGYYREPEATAATRAHDWHHTGDLALIDAQGEVLFIDRKKDMIKSGGENIASSQIEAVLAAHPDVAQVGVVGLPHPHWSEAVAAFVVLKPGAAASEETLLAHARKTLGGFQVPKLLKLVPGIPMTATGKLRKVELRKAHEHHFDHAAKS